MIKNTLYPSAAGFCFLVLTILALSGCGGPDTEEQSPAAALPAAPIAPTYVRLSSSAPPAPMQEDVPEISDLRKETWRAGYWSYDDGQFRWVSGAVISKPTFTAVWMPDHWEKREYGWAFVPGYWQ